MRGDAVKSSHIIDSLRNHYARQGMNGVVPRFAFVDEVRVNTGFKGVERVQERQFGADGSLITKLQPNVVWDPTVKADPDVMWARDGAWVEDGTFREVPDYRERGLVPNRTEARIDAWALDCWKCQRAKAYYMAYAFEVKVSRGDFLGEMKNPVKRLAALELSNYFYFVTPKGLVKASEIPAECGLLTVNATGHVQTVKSAPHREREPLPETFLASALRTATRRYTELAQRMTLETA